MADPSPWQPMTNPADIARMGKLAEELGECSSMAARCLIQGINELDPKTKESNKLMLEDEIADVLANVGLVVEHFKLNEGSIHTRILWKLEFLRKWHRMLDEGTKP